MRLALGCTGGKIKRFTNARNTVINYKNEPFHTNPDTILKSAVTSRR